MRGSSLCAAHTRRDRQRTEAATAVLVLAEAIAVAAVAVVVVAVALAMAASVARVCSLSATDAGTAVPFTVSAENEKTVCNNVYNT